MGVRYYGKGEHPTGWIGFRVTVRYGEEDKQAYFNTRGDQFLYQDDRCVHFKRQRLRAELQDAEWRTESAWYQYRRFVTEDHPTTMEFRRTGVHGLTCDIRRDRRGKWQAGFELNLPRYKGRGKNGRSAGDRIFTFRTRSYTENWRFCVNLWADRYEILDEDRDRVLANPPPASQFKELRRDLNARGWDIPVEVLRPVFREQRESISETRVLEKTDQLIKRAPEHVSSDLAGEMAAWFESVSSNTGTSTS